MLVLATLTTAVISGVILYEMVIKNNFLGEIGLAGIFFASMLSHLTVVGRDIFVPTFLPLTSVYHPMVLGSIAGWGGAIGEMTTYYWGLGIRETIKQDETKNGFFKWINKYGLPAILLVAASPLPDTPIILLAGSARFSKVKLLLIEGVGKTLWYTIGAVLGGFFYLSFTEHVGELVTTTIVIIASTIFCIIVSWEQSRSKIFYLVRKIVSKLQKD
jgi:membrane protein YqaA with SNARE-associated domain